MGALKRAVLGTASAADLAVLLGFRGDRQQALHQAAYAVKSRCVGRTVHLRGLVELGNACRRDCVYCGIRRSNPAVERFRLTVAEIVQCAVRTRQYGYGSLVLQGGELQGEDHTAFIAEALEELHRATGGELAVTLSLGEQSRETYRLWRRAGAHRYLLRMETTDPELYARLHPDRPDPRERRRCLDDLRAEGYQVGTGVLIGVPGQSLIQLARDLLFMRRQDVDMIGMGPYLPHAQTPLGRAAADFDPDRQLDLGLNMIACARLLLPDVNIAATTALQTLAADGRERGLQAGANVIMPNVTDTRYRGAYQLYQGKPHLDENSAASRGRLELAVAALGESIGYGRRGDAPRAVRRGAGLPGGPPTGSGSTDVSGSPGRW